MTEAPGRAVVTELPGRVAVTEARAAVVTAPTDARWRPAVVRDLRHTEACSVILRLDVPERMDHVPGQHYVIRLTAPDGYTASRSYSVVSAPDDPQVEFFVERLPDGEVSGFLADEVRVGDRLEVRGPIGGWFVWDASTPALGIGGGSGVAPFVSMLRHTLAIGEKGGPTGRLRLAVSARRLSLLPYAEEFEAAGATIALTADADGVRRSVGRLGWADLAPLVDEAQTALVCGSAGFAEAMSRLLVDRGVPAGDVRVERFGPSA
ncbi:MAG: FAD-binding oxidoreductase [bacterium]